MRLSFRFIVPLILVLVTIAYAVVPLADRLTLRWAVRDLTMRASLITNTMQEPLQELIDSGNQAKMLQVFTRITQDERLFAIAYCPSPNARPLATAPLPPEIRCSTLGSFLDPSGHLFPSAHGLLHITVKPLSAAGAPDGRLVFVHDMSFVERRSQETRRYLFYFFVVLAIAISLITVVIAQLSWRGWVQGLRAILHGEGLLRASVKPPASELGPIPHDIRALIEDLRAEQQSRERDRITWTPEVLREVLRSELRGQEIIVVANREPYIHVYQGDAIVVRRPASGLVTALEPIMRACSGTWIAHGSGSADRAVVDRNDRVAVPRENPSYQIRRVWLTPEEEAGYYYGFANEGLWPLCHIAHVRPTFRRSDWEQYAAVNRKFADAVVQESKSKDPIVLVQDYHFALLPTMVRESMPGATIITFWHIPWPNPEAFGICPWREELLHGLLGSAILGFHTQFHCNNFIDTVDRMLEARIDRETLNVSYQGRLTAVNRYPISVEWPPPPAMVTKTVEKCRRDVRERHKLPLDHAIGVGVDRLDYTKGIEERLRAVERLLEIHPEWVGRFTFIQVAAPSRTPIEKYREYDAHVRAMAAGINERFAGAGHPPIVLKVEHHEPQDVYEYFRAAELCFVNSLHDGMNLVAKEFVAARDDERGVLVLSRFTGAARELPEAIIVNPYDTEECAAALCMALTMPAAEQGQRIRLMRGLIQDFNVYRWAGRMLMDAAHMRRRNSVLDQGGGVIGRRSDVRSPVDEVRSR
ncbi:MAG TPA: trehalose-6-phosphate synthase [Thermoanaerobaculia bacterium]|nr:trehalose-6-phosphate synthase [Thermoanaerobaculia bacterium]